VTGEEAHILYRDGVYPSLLEFMNQLLGSFQLVVIDNGIDRYIDLGSELVGIVTQLTDVVDAIACRYSGTKLGSTNIYGISAMVNGCDTALKVLGRCQQF
jgi:hypothetical protein